MRTPPTFLSPMEMANTKVGAAEALLLSFHSWDVLLSPSFQSLFFVQGTITDKYRFLSF